MLTLHEPRRRRRPALAVAALTTAVGVVGLGVTAPSAAAAPPPATAPATVIVMAQPGQLPAVTAQALRLGARINRQLPLISGFSATLPAAAAERLSRSAAVRSVTPDSSGRLLATDPTLGYDPSTNFGSMNQISKVIGAQDAWKAGYTGKGVDVALIDSGVSRVTGLSDKVVNGPDLSFDSQDPELTQLDGYGHGTHMAGLIAGRDSAQSTGSGYVTASAHQFVGVAPDARIVSVKVGAADGAVDVSQVIAGIDWVVQHAKDPGMNIRVLNLSFGTNNTAQPYWQDPLAFAAEQAWRRGIVVVVAAGNDGLTTSAGLADPAYNPVLLAVGASDPQGTVLPSNDIVAPFANHGVSARPVDLVAPGVQVLGLRAPASTLDVAHPGARVGTRFFRGSGTSQSAALVSGAAALLLQKYPAATPNGVKAMLMNNAYNFSAPANYRGAGSVDVGLAISRKLSTGSSGGSASPGGGLLDLSRGDSFVNDGMADLRGEVDIFGTPFNSAAMASLETQAAAWSGARWNGNEWTGTGWTDPTASWTGRTWTGRTWTGRTWTGRTWTGRTWTGRTWTGRTWTSASWG